MITTRDTMPGFVAKFNLKLGHTEFVYVSNCVNMMMLPLLINFFVQRASWSDRSSINEEIL
jgi:hypothetical protein